MDEQQIKKEQRVPEKNSKKRYIEIYIYISMQVLFIMQQQVDEGKGAHF